MACGVQLPKGVRIAIPGRSLARAKKAVVPAACDPNDASSSHSSRTRPLAAIRRRQEDRGGDRAGCDDDGGDRTVSGIPRRRWRPRMPVWRPARTPIARAPRARPRCRAGRCSAARRSSCASRRMRVGIALDHPRRRARVCLRPPQDEISAMSTGYTLFFRRSIPKYYSISDTKGAALPVAVTYPDGTV